MLQKLKIEDLDMVVGSRNISGQGIGEFAANRVMLSNTGRNLSDAICKVPVSSAPYVKPAWLQEFSDR
jgi:hypothetical protein